MTSPPGTYQQSCAFPDGTEVLAVVHFNVTTEIIEDVGTPPGALIVTNNGPRVAKVIVTGVNGPQTFNVSPGTTRVRATQLAAQGLTTKSDVAAMSVACGS